MAVSVSVSVAATVAGLAGGVWSQHNIWVGDEFRDGNVPAQFEILAFVKQVFARLPKGIRQLSLRGDSALYDEELLSWLDDQKIGFAVSADMSESLRATIEALDEKEWKPYKGNNERADQREERQWAEVVFVPDWKRNRRKEGKPLRYIGIRMRSRQRELYEEDERRWRHFAVVTNLDDAQWKGGRVLRWHRKKQGTVEQANGVVKNDLGGGVLPCGRFGANAAWWRLNMLAHNLLELLKLLLPGDWELVRPKTLRFRLFRMAGRLVRHARQWVLRISSAHPLARAYEKARRTLVRWSRQVLAEEVVAG